MTAVGDAVQGELGALREEVGGVRFVAEGTSVVLQRHNAMLSAPAEAVGAAQAAADAAPHRGRPVGGRKADDRGQCVNAGSIWACG